MSQRPPIVEGHSRSGARVRLDGALKQAIETGRTRLLLATVMFALGFGAIGVRLIDVSLLQDSGDRAQAGSSAAITPTERGDIVDRNGVVLATSLATYSLFADPAMVLDAAEAATKLSRVLPEMDREQVLADLRSDRRFVWLRRHLTPRQYDSINRLGIPGLSFRPEERRVYPHGPLTSHILGFTDIDNQGIAGAEKYFDKALGRGTRLALSIDIRVQHALREELAASMETFRAIGASGLVLDVRTGEIAAMVSLPDFDPNDRASASQEAQFNRNTLGVYEMGSTFKIFTTAAALETGVATLADSFDARNPIRVARFVINDYKPRHKWLTVPEIFVYSSNIGAAKMALEIGTARLQDFFGRIGLLTNAEIELPEIGEPMQPSPWREINTMTASYGHGIAVSPLHLARAVAAIANDGVMVPTTLRKRLPDDDFSTRRVVSSRTSAALRSLMRQVVERGTGRKANAPGYFVGGKTGSADKYRQAGGKRGLLSSFVGIFPANAPRYVVLIMLDEPKGTKETFNRATGGWVAAPATGRLITQIAPLLGVAPVRDILVEPDVIPVMHVSSGVQKRASR